MYSSVAFIANASVIYLYFHLQSCQTLANSGSGLKQLCILTVDLPYPGTPYSLWTCPIPEPPADFGSFPPWNTLLTMDMPPCGKPYLPWTCPTAVHPTDLRSAHLETPYSLDGKKP